MYRSLMHTLYPVHMQHFAQDDPELYQGKVQHLLQHGTSLLPEPLYFTDHQMTPTGTLKVMLHTSPC